MPTEYEGKGNDYMKAPVEERFEIKDRKAIWKNRSEHGEQSVTGEHSMSRLIHRQNLRVCLRVLWSKRLVTSCHFCQPAKQALSISARIAGSET